MPERSSTTREVHNVLRDYDEFRFSSAADALLDRLANVLACAGIACWLLWVRLDIGLWLLLAAFLIKFRVTPLKIIAGILLGLSR